MVTSYSSAIRELERQEKIMYASPTEQSTFGPPDEYAHFAKPNSPSDGIDVCNTNRLHPLFRGFSKKYGHLMTGVISNWGPGAGVETSELADIYPNAERIIAVGYTPFDTHLLLQKTYTEIRTVIDTTSSHHALIYEEQNRSDDTLNLDALSLIQDQLGYPFFRSAKDSERRIEEWIGDAQEVAKELFDRRNPQMKLDIQYDNVGAQYYWMLEHMQRWGHAADCIDFALKRMSGGGCLFLGKVPPGISPMEFTPQQSGNGEHIVIACNGTLFVANAEGKVGADLIAHGFDVGVNTATSKGSQIFHFMKHLMEVDAKK